MKKTLRNGTMCELPDDGVHPDQLMAFDDVPLYSLVKLRGYTAYVIDKGEHIGQNDGRYMLLSYESANSPRNRTRLHERVVNKYLHEQRNLFVDFTGDMMVQHDVNPDDIRS